MVHKETKDKIRKTLSDKFGLDVDYEKIEKIAIVYMRMYIIDNVFWMTIIMDIPEIGNFREYNEAIINTHD